MGFKSIRVAIFYAGLPKPNATLLFYPGLGPAMLRRLRRESLPPHEMRIIELSWLPASLVFRTSREHVDGQITMVKRKKIAFG